MVDMYITENKYSSEIYTASLEVLEHIPCK